MRRDNSRGDKEDSGAPRLSVTDLIDLLRLALIEDTYILDGHLRKQVTGIAMGNNAAPILSSIFMHFVEKRIMDDVRILFWVRFVDDVLLIYRPDLDILRLSNNAHSAITFTLQQSKSNELPFLDTIVK